MDSHELFQDRLRWLFAEALAGRLEILVDRVIPLADAAEALRALAMRKTIGKVVLDPRHG